MRGNNMLGIIFSDIEYPKMRCLSENRTLGSVPFGGRYRLIDFALSNMVNSGIDKVGVVVKGNYRSILNHLGSGKNWDLSKKNGGIYILPPFGNDCNFKNKIQTLSYLKDFISGSREDYVLLCDGNYVCNIDYKDILNNHIKNNADITIVYNKENLLKKSDDLLIIDLDDNDRVINTSECSSLGKECRIAYNMFVLKKSLLNSLVSDCVRNDKLDFNRDIIHQNLKTLNIYGYKFNGFLQNITSVNTYFDANMMLLNENIRQELFNPERPIYTKIKDDMPARYGKVSKISGCMVSNGCEIEGEVSNSIIFRGVKIGKDAKISNCILMKNTTIEDNCVLNYVITDKGVTIKNSRSLMGYYSYPIYIEKGKVI